MELQPLLSNYEETHSDHSEHLQDRRAPQKDSVHIPYAARGHVFKDPELKEFFESCFWYMPDPNYKDDTSDFTASDWEYRRCHLPSGVVLTEIVLKLQEVSTAEENELILSELNRRSRVTPRGRSAGSVFRNPPGQFAGALLEQCGCKGLSVNNLRVSEQHANWIVKEGDEPGMAMDCRQLVEEMRRRVQKQFGITLETEWRWV